MLTAAFYLLLCLVINRVYISDKRVACWINPQFQRLGGQEYRIMKDWKGSDSYDVIVSGSSHAYRGYDPRIFAQNNLSMYAAGSGFQNTLAGYVLIKNVFQPAKGSVVIIDLFDQTFEGDGTGCYTRIIQNVSDAKSAVEIVQRQPDLRSFNSLMCRFMSDLNRVEVPDEPGYLMNGYNPKTDTTGISDSELIKHTDFNPDFRKYLHELITFVRSKNAIPVLVSHPQPHTKTNEKFHEEFLVFLKPLLEDEDIIYLDYNTNHPLSNNTHFADENHLNQAGVDWFNHRLIEDLRSNNIIGQ